jgi:hypothetical protein
MIREAVLLVPGIRPSQQGEHLDTFVSGLQGSVEIARCSNPSPAAIEGLKGKCMTCRFLAGGEEKQVDIYECFLSDLVPDLANAAPLLKLRDGTRLIFFWLFSGIWRAFRRNKYFALTALASSLMLLVWYLAVLAVGLTAIGNLPIDPENRLLAQAAAAVGRIGASLGQWSVWIGIGTLLSFLRVGRIANISHFLRLYLESEDVRNAIRLRVRDPLYQIIEKGEYSCVTVLAHSFGVLVTTDVMADFVQTGAAKVHVISLGGPVAVLLKVGSWVQRELDKCQKNSAITSWVDFSSDSDWMGDRMPFSQPVFDFRHETLDDMGGWIKRFTGGTHHVYFNRQEVTECVISCSGFPPPPSDAVPSRKDD